MKWHPEDQQEPGQLVRPGLYCSFCCQMAVCTGPVHQPPQVCWALPVLWAAAAGLLTPPQPRAAQLTALPGLCSVSALHKYWLHRLPPCDHLENLLPSFHCHLNFCMITQQIQGVVWSCCRVRIILKNPQLSSQRHNQRK